MQHKNSFSKNNSQRKGIAVTFEMKLHDTPFYQLKSGEKTVELRLFDEKRRGISKGDVIVFSRRQNPSETIKASVVALHCYPTFAELFATPLFQKCGWSDLSPAEAKAEMRRYYSEQEEIRYGALGIELELI